MNNIYIDSLNKDRDQGATILFWVIISVQPAAAAVPRNIILWNGIPYFSNLDSLYFNMQKCNDVENVLKYPEKSQWILLEPALK